MDVSQSGRGKVRNQFIIFADLVELNLIFIYSVIQLTRAWALNNCSRAMILPFVLFFFCQAIAMAVILGMQLSILVGAYSFIMSSAFILAIHL